MAATQLPSNNPRARELDIAIKGGDTDALQRMLGANPHLATCVVIERDGGGRTPLHLLADASGQRPRSRRTAEILVGAGADIDAPAVGMGHIETPLHWAASNDDVALIDALLDLGADIEHPGSSIDGGPPIQSALGYGMWKAVARLFERGATANLSHLVVLGLVDRVGDALVDTTIPQETLDVGLWNACRRGDVVIAAMLIERGADLGWAAPWSDETPLDIARSCGHQHLLERLGAPSG
jgi:ankyrin repeat protein